MSFVSIFNVGFEGFCEEMIKEKEIMDLNNNEKIFVLSDNLFYVVQLINGFIIKDNGVFLCGIQVIDSS